MNMLLHTKNFAPAQAPKHLCFTDLNTSASVYQLMPQIHTPGLPGPQRACFCSCVRCVYNMYVNHTQAHTYSHGTLSSALHSAECTAKARTSRNRQIKWNGACLLHDSLLTMALIYVGVGNKCSSLFSAHSD